VRAFTSYNEIALQTGSIRLAGRARNPYRGRPTATGKPNAARRI
jgi:hypothetical protein